MEITHTDKLNAACEALLREHSARYPMWVATDAVKLLMQTFCGAGHLCPELNVLTEYITREMHTLPPTQTFNTYEDLPTGLCRLYLSDLPRDTKCAEWLARAVATGINDFSVRYTDFEHALNYLQKHAENYGLDSTRTAQFISGYIAAGTPVISHSPTYRAEYLPAYRLVHIDVAHVFADISALLLSTPNAVIAIDGRCGAGKSTLAKRLAKIYDADILHTDDFYLPQELRTAERLSEFGGNIHYERLRSVTSELRTADSILYDKFDCSKMDYTQSGSIDRARPLIVEGSYALHPVLGDYCDYAVFCDIDTPLREERIRHRDGNAALEMFRTRWIPMEEAYFTHFDITDRCDTVIQARATI